MSDTDNGKSAPKKVYVASPMGFSEATRSYMNEVVLPMLRELGLEIIDPWALTPKREMLPGLAISDYHLRQQELKKLRFVIGERNAIGIANADFLVANLDGQEMDSGSASEIGAASVLKKPIFAWCSDFRQSGELGAVVNLQVEYFILSSNGSISGDLHELQQALRTYLGL